MIQTHDPRLPAAGLPAYPPLPAAYNARQIEEIRRTLLAIDLDPDITSQQIIDHFTPAGQVKYVRFCDRDSDTLRYALIEFTEQESIVKGLKLNGTKINGHTIKVSYIYLYFLCSVNNYKSFIPNIYRFITLLKPFRNPRRKVTKQRREKSKKPCVESRRLKI